VCQHSSNGRQRISLSPSFQRISARAIRNQTLFYFLLHHTMDIQALMNVVLKLSTQVQTLARQQSAAATTAPEPAAILPPAPAVPVAAAVQQPLFAIVTPPSTGDNGSPADSETPLTRFNSIGSSASSCSFVTPLTRFNSIGSSASSSSFDSSSTRQKQSAKKKLTFKRRRRANALTSHYRSRVRKPILELLDEKYLVPEESPLFQRTEGTSRKLPDGSYKLKLHAELKLPLFQQLVRPLLLQMLGSQMYKSTNKVNKLVDAMKFVVKKRRANHNYRRGKKIPLCAIYRSTGFVYEVDLDALPEPAVSDLSVPEPALPQPVLPEAVVPEPALPEAVVPEPALPEPALPEPVLPEPALSESVLPEPALPQCALSEPALSESVLPEPPTVKAASAACPASDSDSDSDTIDLDATESEHDSDFGEILSDLFATDDDLDVPSTDEDYSPPKKLPCSGLECKQVMLIADAYPQLPKQTWGDQEDTSFYCETCWEKRKTDLFAKLGAKYPQPHKNKKRQAPATKKPKKKVRKTPVTKKSKRKAPVTRKPKRKAPVTKKSKKKVRKSPTPNTPPQRVLQPVGTPEAPNTPKFPVGTTQNAKWTDGKFYTAHITKYHAATKTYDVYFPDDAETLDGLPENKIQSPLSANGFRSRPRESFIGEKFVEHGDQTVQPGVFQVKLVVDKVHEYVCERLTGENPGEIINYDVGCVIRGVLDNTSIVNL
jgi:hypothetical protein